MSPRIATTRSISRRRLWAIIGIAAFLLVDVALVGWAISTTRGTSDPSKAGPIPTFTAVPPTGTPTPTSTPSAAAVQAAPRVLAAVSATEAYRATPGACSGGDTVIEKTTDAGATWTAEPIARYNFHTVLALADAADSRVSAVVGAGANCTVGYFSSFTGGQFWQEYPANLGAANFVDPADRTKIHTEAGIEASPCPSALQLAVDDGSAAVLCADSVAVRAGQGEWATVPVSGALAITAGDSGYTVAASGVPGCAGVAIETITAAADAATQPTQVGCATGLADTSGLTLAQSGSELWLWSGSTVAVSHDAGATW